MCAWQNGHTAGPREDKVQAWSWLRPQPAGWHGTRVKGFMRGFCSHHGGGPLGVQRAARTQRIRLGDHRLLHQLLRLKLVGRQHARQVRNLAPAAGPPLLLVT
jgi:hypothetical protein